MLQAIFALAGVWLFGVALLDLYAINNPNNMQGQANRQTIGGVVVRLIVSVVLTSAMYFLVLTQNTLAGTAASSGHMLYQGAGLSEVQKAAIDAIFAAFAILGYVAFCKGWLVLDKHFNGGNQGWGSAVAFMIGGTLAVFMQEWLANVSLWTGFDFVKILLF